MSNFRTALLAFLGTFALPALALAHEVYVLTPQEISTDVMNPPFNMVHVALQNLSQFVFWGFIAFVVIGTVFCISIFRRLERSLDPFLDRIKRHAPAVCRITVGLGLLAGAYYQATYGPELPLLAAYGALTPLVTALIVFTALLMLSGYWVRVAAVIALCFYAVAVFLHGTYMLTYANYFGEFVVLLLLGTHGGKHRSTIALWRKIERAVAPYSFAVIRICFGISLLYASLYAKILHNNLALDVAQLPLAGHPFGIAHYFGFDPHFMVLGAAIIEIIIALFFILGIEIRWTCLFLEFWLSLSLWWFGETVWPHLILIGIPIALFMHGYDRYSLEGYFFKKRRLEPVL